MCQRSLFTARGLGKGCGSPKVTGSNPCHSVTSVAIRLVTMTTRVDNYSAMQETRTYILSHGLAL